MSVETMHFQTEMTQLLRIIVHSLYSNKEIFLRELISNACDAIDKVRFEGLTKHELNENDTDWKIKLIPDKEKKTLTVSDNGIGMNREELIQNLGTIARSGTREFLKQLSEAQAKDRPGLIGQFGVGFYSALMVADKIEVLSRKAGEREAWLWTTDGQGQFTIESGSKIERGTQIVLYLKPDEDEFLESYRLRSLVKKYSDFIEHPIVMDVERTKDTTVEEGEAKEKKEPEKEIVEETLNSRQALWLRNKDEIKKEEYTEFYHHVAHDYGDPFEIIHYQAEGTLEFKALLFFPKHKPMDHLMREPKSGLHLYIQRVFITDECDALLPPYMRFVKGVVDSADLPLNVSREILQENRILEKIRANLVKKVISTLETMQNKEPERYREFYEEFSVYIKEGVGHDWENKEKLSELLLYQSTRTETGKYRTLAQYVAEMPAEQKEIYYLIGENRMELENSPYLESFAAKGWEVLLMTEPVDEFVTQGLRYKEKNLRAVNRGDLPEELKQRREAEQEQYKEFFEKLQTSLPKVKEIRISHRLKDSAACLVADEHEMSAHMERLMRRMGRGDDLPENKRILELNIDHPIVAAVQKIFQDNPTDERLESFAKLLYDQALIAEGSRIEDPTGFAKRVNTLLLSALK